LPSPILTEGESVTPAYEPVDEQGNPAARYDMLESVSFAFLLALEALTPAQRAVLLLRDVFDYSVRETAVALAMSEANVKTTHARARRAMIGYDQTRAKTSPALQEHARQMLERFLHCLSQNDVAGVEALLARDVVALSDGGGEFFAARVPVKGPAKVAQFYLYLTKKIDAATVRIQPLWLNGTAAMLFDFGPQSARYEPRYAPRSVILLDIRATGEIGCVYSVLASRKLAALKNLASET
jgi:RNA polymerase sigma-70 factor (ECF subfamily)